jgi:hypothetical protein
LVGQIRKRNETFGMWEHRVPPLTDRGAALHVQIPSSVSRFLRIGDERGVRPYGGETPCGSAPYPEQKEKRDRARGMIG